MRSTPFLEPDPLERLRGSSLAGNRPETTNTKIRMLISSLSATKRGIRGSTLAWLKTRSFWEGSGRVHSKIHDFRGRLV